MWPKLIALLIASFGLAEGANDDQAVAHLKTLTADQQASLAEAMGGDAKDKIALLVKPKTAPAPRQADDFDADAEVVALETKRVTHIHALGSTMKQVAPASLSAAIDGAVLESVSKNLTLAQARQAMQAAMAKAAPAIPGTIGTISVGEDADVASLRAAIPQAIMLRANPSVAMEKIESFEAREARDQMQPGRVYLGKIHPRAMQLRRLTVLGMFRSYLRSLGVDGSELENMGNVALANTLGPRALRQRFPKMALLAESTSDFASITLDAINKSMRFMYLDAKRTWDIWAQRQTNADFKNINRVVLSEAPDMNSATEGKEINYVALSDSKETYSLAEYKAGIKLTRRAIINDDLDAFSQIPRAQANSAARKEDDVAYAIITANAALADSVTLFHASHSNSQSTAAISIASLQTAATAMKKQKGLAAAARLELKPKFLLVPTSIEETTIQLIGSPDVFPVTGATPNPMGTKNPFYNRYQVVGSTRLDDNDVNDWYLMADYREGQVNTVEVCFLTDEPEPVVRQETDFDTEDVKYLVRHTVAAKAIDFRGMQKTAGA